MYGSDTDASDKFGISVSVDGNYAIVGAEGGNGGKGSAYIFYKSSGTWAQQAKLVASDAQADDKFGEYSCISGDYAIVGAPSEDTGSSQAGSAYIFKRTGTSWVEQAKIQASDKATSDYFGKSVAILGDYAFIGSPYNDDNGSQSGSTYVFLRNGTTWSQQDKLIASDAANGYEFGLGLSMSGDYAIVGANGTTTRQGSAYIFKSCLLYTSPSPRDP